MSIVEQAGRVHDASGGSLSRELAGAVMVWARDAKAYRHMVSFEMLDEAVAGGLDGKTTRRDVTAEDLSRVGDAVRTWIAPHLRDGATTAGLDEAVSQAFHRPKGFETKGRDDVEPTIVVKVDRAPGR
jgi:hypothetical protein